MSQTKGKNQSRKGKTRDEKTKSDLKLISHTKVWPSFPSGACFSANIFVSQGWLAKFIIPLMSLFFWDSRESWEGI